MDFFYFKRGNQLGDLTSAVNLFKLELGIEKNSSH